MSAPLHPHPTDKRRRAAFMGRLAIAAAALVWLLVLEIVK